MVGDARGDAFDAETLLPGRFRVEGTLGEGGFGTVVKAFDTRLKRTVAIKTLKRAAFAEDLDRFRMLEERFAREAEAGSRMGVHPNLVTVYDLVVDDDRTQRLILEYVAGGTLAERIKAGTLSVADALRIAADAARGLGAAHAHGIVHRDVKPANIFLTDEEVAKVGDFGIAQIDDISHRTHTTAGHPGTPIYMSPEQAASTGYVRPSSDQYSLGLVFFEMLTGKVHKRLERADIAALLAAQPKSVRAVVERMLATDSGDRYAGMPSVIAAIHEAERELDTAPPGVPTDPLRTPTLLDATVRVTPLVNLSPMSPVAAPSVSRMGRRTFLIGAGGLALAGGAAGVMIFSTRASNPSVATATPPAPTSVAVLAAVQSTATATITPSATSTQIPSPTPIVVTATSVATAPPIVITAPPVVITATPPPTATATPVVVTAPPVIITATPIPTKQPQVVTWTDRQGRVQMMFPSSWNVAPSPGQDEVLDIESGDGVGVTVYISLIRNETAMSGITGYRDRQSKRTDRLYVFGSITPGKIGGATSQSITCTSTSRQNPSDTRVVEMHYVANGQWLYAFETFAQGSTWRRRDEILAMLRSVLFG